MSGMIIGLDLAKSVFQVHAVDADGKVVITRKVRRSQMLEFFGRLDPCLVGMEACPSAHHWARELSAYGHSVRLIAPHYVKPFIKRQKNDAADGLCCTNRVRDSSRESSVLGANHEQTDTPRLQDPQLAGL